MTFSHVSSNTAPEVADCYEDIVCSHKVVESNLALIDMYMSQLAKEKVLLMQRRTSLVQQIQQMRLQTSSVARLPIPSIAAFLSTSDLCTLRRTSHQFKELCSPDNKFVVVHLASPKASLSMEAAVCLVTGVAHSLVASLVIDAKRPSGRVLLKALLPFASNLTSLTSLRVNAAADTGDFLADLFVFMNRLPSHILRTVHFSGLRSIAHVGVLLTCQNLSIEEFKVDYFVNGHEKDILDSYLPVMPKLRSFMYDVADITQLNVELIYARLMAIENKAAVESIYLPHMEIGGDVSKLCAFVALIKEFSFCKQLVIRFRRLPLSVREIVSLRETFAALPAVCISDHFVVCQSTWCPWWPSLTEVWSRADEITGLSVFREQIDFESLGTSAGEEWSKLTSEQQEMWTRKIAPKIHDLYVNAQ